MIGIDTNVLVRYFTRDDPEQFARASDFLEKRLSREQPGFINRIVLVELVWVLESAYGVGQVMLADVVDRLLRTAELVIEDADDAREALRRYRTSRAGLADLLVGVGNERRGCVQTVTFDRKAAFCEGFVQL